MRAMKRLQLDSYCLTLNLASVTRSFEFDCTRRIRSTSARGRYTAVLDPDPFGLNV
jgi:hypothetical protein